MHVTGVPTVKTLVREPMVQGVYKQATWQVLELQMPQGFSLTALLYTLCTEMSQRQRERQERLESRRENSWRVMITVVLYEWPVLTCSPAQLTQAGMREGWLRGSTFPRPHLDLRLPSTCKNWPLTSGAELLRGIIQGTERRGPVGERFMGPWGDRAVAPEVRLAPDPGPCRPAGRLENQTRAGQW